MYENCMVLKFVRYLQILLFLSKRSFVHFLDGQGEGGQNWSFFVDLINV